MAYTLYLVNLFFYSVTSSGDEFMNCFYVFLHYLDYVQDDLSSIYLLDSKVWQYSINFIPKL